MQLIVGRGEKEREMDRVSGEWADGTSYDRSDRSKLNSDREEDGRRTRE